MKNRILFLGIAVCLCCSVMAGKEHYQAAFNELQRMLLGQQSISFKRAVFVTENAYYGGSLSYEQFNADIATVTSKLQVFIKKKRLEQYKTASNFAVWSFMRDSIPENEKKTFSYDFDDFMGEKDWTKMFVTKLMRTRSGNCHSLPYYYKILTEEMKGEALLALGPNHVYIKHKDEKGQWTNIELTNGSFPRDSWVMSSLGVTVDAIKSGAYMTPLTQKESIAICLFDLANSFERQFSIDDPFYMKCINTAITYYPKCIPLLMNKANYYKAQVEKEKVKGSDRMTAATSTWIAEYKATVAKIDELGYKDMPSELYAQWVKDVESEKSKQKMIKTNK